MIIALYPKPRSDGISLEIARSQQRWMLRNGHPVPRDAYEAAWGPLCLDCMMEKCLRERDGFLITERAWLHLSDQERKEWLNARQIWERQQAEA